MRKKQKNKIIVLGDTHGRNKWQDIVDQTFDKVIFLGDYFDSFYIPFEEQMDNFKKIISFKIKNPDKVVLLLGNHDYHYLSYVKENYSGFQSDNKLKISAYLGKCIEDGLIKICHSEKKWFFTHAGITQTWLKNCGGNIKDVKGMSEAINNIFWNNPFLFGFTEGINHDNSGDDITQSPLWVRPYSLDLDKIPGIKQVVGHTKQDMIFSHNGLFFVDALEYGNEFLVIENGKSRVCKVL